MSVRIKSYSQKYNSEYVCILQILIVVSNKHKLLQTSRVKQKCYGKSLLPYFLTVNIKIQ
jgi:hypothetical protein